MDINLADIESFEWDAGNRPKVEKRVPISVVESAFLGQPLISYDDTHSKIEQRWFLMNQVEKRHVFLIFTVRHKKIRIISARYMHKQEVNKYGKKIS